MADVKALVEDAAQFARQAVQCDQQGLVDTAIFYYTVSILDFVLLCTSQKLL